MNGAVELTITDILEIIAMAGTVIGIYIKLNNKIIEDRASAKAAESLHKQRIDQMESDYKDSKESIRNLKAMVYKQNDDVTKALHENAAAIRELRVTLEYIREDKN